MTKKRRRKRKTKSQTPVEANGAGVGEEDEDKIVGEISSLSLVENEKTIGDLLENVSSYPSTSGSSSYFDSNTEDPSTSSSSSSYERFLESELVELPKGRQKKVVASSGMVSGVIGKEYVRSSPAGCGRRSDAMNAKDWRRFCEEAEQFLCSMLGEDCELSLAVVKDVLCQCGYDVEKALDALLELSASSDSQVMDGDFSNFTRNCEQDSRSLGDKKAMCQLPGWMSDSHLSENQFQPIRESSGHDCRKYSEVLLSSARRSSSSPGIREQCLPQTVLESLFNVPKSSEHEPNGMNWKNVVKKMESLGQGLNAWAGGATEQQNTEFAAGEEYQVFRKAATEHYDAMKSYYQKAATAYSKGNREYAGYLSEQGQVHNRIAREADEKASREIFEARNKAVQNVVTIDLHGQHVKQAIKLLKVHLLLFTTYVSSVQFLRVITGCGAHGVGRGKLKQSVIGLIEKAGIEWNEENRGTVMVKLEGQRDLNFGESEGECDS